MRNFVVLGAAALMIVLGLAQASAATNVFGSAGPKAPSIYDQSGAYNP